MSQLETAPNVAKRRCFVHFDLQMCFAPQRRAIFWHLIFKKWPVPVSFFTFWLTNALRATVACHFWTSELQKVARECGVFHILTYKCTSRHSGVQFLRIETSKIGPRLWCFAHFELKFASRHSGVPFLNIGTSKIGPSMRCFVHFALQMCFAPQRRAIFHPSARTGTSAPAALARLLFEHQEARIIEKTQRFATSLNIWRTCTFFLVTLHACCSSFCWLDISTLLFQLCILSEVRLLNFLR